LELVDYLNQKYKGSIPVAALTAAHKLYGKGRPLNKEDRFVKRFSDGKGNVETLKLVDYLGKNEVQERGKGLSEDAMKRVYGNFANHDGKLTFEYIMKMGESCGVAINERTAKAIVRKYGKRKDHLNLDDCLKINERRRESSISPPKRGK
jgi:Ca2+-binding EF-hand superfamily protein